MMKRMLALTIIFLSACRDEPERPAAPGPGLLLTSPAMGFQVRLPSDEWSAGVQQPDPAVKACAEAGVMIVARNHAIDTAVSFTAVDDARGPGAFAKAIFASPDIGHVTLYRNEEIGRAELETRELVNGKLRRMRAVFVSRDDKPGRVIGVIGVSPFEHGRAMERGVDDIVAGLRPIDPPQ